MTGPPAMVADAFGCGNVEGIGNTTFESTIVVGVLVECHAQGGGGVSAGARRHRGPALVDDGVREDQGTPRFVEVGDEATEVSLARVWVGCAGSVERRDLVLPVGAWL